MNNEGSGVAKARLEGENNNWFIRLMGADEPLGEIFPISNNYCTRDVLNILSGVAFGLQCMGVELGPVLSGLASRIERAPEANDMPVDI